MKSKKQPDRKVLDVSRPKKRASGADVPSAPQLVIPKRSIIPISGPEPEDPVSEPIETKRTAESVQPAGPSLAEPEPEQTPAEPELAEASAEPDTQPGKAAPDTSEEPAEPEEPDSGNANHKSAKANAHVRKALEDAKREQELQGYIENREFFVPINAVARKRSLKVSAGLVFLELLLGLFLLNLMLDAGVIQLLEKIPHTSFFDL